MTVFLGFTFEKVNSGKSRLVTYAFRSTFYVNGPDVIIKEPFCLSLQDYFHIVKFTRMNMRDLIVLWEPMVE